MHRGWIVAFEKDRAELEAMGIKLGAFTNAAFEYCAVSDEAFEKLEPLWGRFYWGLTHVEGT